MRAYFILFTKNKIQTKHHMLTAIAISFMLCFLHAFVFFFSKISFLHVAKTHTQLQLTTENGHCKNAGSMVSRLSPFKWQKREKLK